MRVIFGNVLGWYALLGVPCLIAIHFLHQKSKRISISTLFLLERSNPQSIKGSRFQRFRFSTQFFLQLAFVSIMIWLLLDPHWLRKDSLLRVAVVMDSSVSLRAFLPGGIEKIEAALKKLRNASAQIEWLLSETHESRNVLYRGTNFREFMQVLTRWQPQLGTHDVYHPLSLTRELIGAKGVVVFVSDRPATVPPGVRLVSIGEPFDNAGFTGMRLASSQKHSLMWQALVRNYGQHRAEREWWIAIEGKEKQRHALVIEPGQSALLKGEFPKRAEKFTVNLTADRFNLDDVLPFVRPLERELRIHVEAASSARDIVLEVLKSIPGITFSSDRERAALAVEAFRAGRHDISKRTAIVFLDEAEGTPIGGDLVAARHPLMQGLVWNGAAIRAAANIEPGKNDQVLLWAGDRPLIFQRQAGPHKQLIFNFDLRQSNVRELPAFVLLLYRFIETIRAEQPGFQRLNIIGGQLLPINAVEGMPISVSNQQLSSGILDVHEHTAQELPLLRVPIEPAFLDIRQDKNRLFTGAIQFSDAREADFQDAQSADEASLEGSTLALAQSEIDSFQRLWVLAALMLALASWNLSGAKPSIAAGATGRD